VSTDTEVTIDTAFPEETPTAGHTGSGRWQSLLLAGAGYLALSVVMWWNVWAGHPTSATTCGCGDPALFLSFIEWPAHAITHGLNPFYSSIVNHPAGVNMLANTSVLAIGVALAPVTWLWGPVATLNVASTLAPVLSALAMYLLLRRWVSWSPAAFVGGLLYGFSPFMVIALSWAHLMMALTVVPPLLVIGLDQLLVRQTRPPLLVGVGLGLLVTLQFFIGSEILLIVALLASVALVLVVAYAGVVDAADLRRRAAWAWKGLAAGVATAVVLLAYPVWFALDGPGHFSGPVWPASSPDDAISRSGTLLGHFIHAPPAQTGSAHLDHLLGGYQGPILSDQFLGVGLLVVLVVGVVVWRHDRRLWLFGAVGIVSAVLSLGVKAPASGAGAFIAHWLPWRLVAGLPVLNDVYPYRIIFITYMAAAVMLGVIIDHTYWSVRRRAGARMASRVRPWVAGAAGLGVAVVALAPLAAFESQTFPLTTRTVDLPAWFTRVAPHLPGHQVLLAFPARAGVISDNDNPMAWQAVDGMDYSIVEAGGPSGIPQRAGPERLGQVALAGASRPPGAAASVPVGAAADVRRALADWGVTLVVIPDQAGLPAYDQISSAPAAVRLISAATGERPIHQDDAWVWSGVATAVRRHAVSRPRTPRGGPGSGPRPSGP
jgi:hypothetical protein